MENLTQIVYISEATHEMSSNDLLGILNQARKNNSSSGITGMLLFSNSHFIQVLEGESHEVETTYNRIKQDTSHKDIAILHHSTITKRDFPNWTMGYHFLSEYETRELNNFFPAFNVSLSNASIFKTPTEAKELLLNFIYNNLDGVAA